MLMVIHSPSCVSRTLMEGSLVGRQTDRQTDRQTEEQTMLMVIHSPSCVSRTLMEGSLVGRPDSRGGRQNSSVSSSTSWPSFIWSGHSGLTVLQGSLPVAVGVVVVTMMMIRMIMTVMTMLTIANDDDW